MPCFHGLAVSIHAPDGPLPEYSIQKQSRQHRITSYIPVPPAKIPDKSTSNKPEQSTFAISITLLTPGLNVPYSAPKPTLEDPYPRPKVVGGLPGQGSERGRYGPVIGPYVPLTASQSETIAAYIYFDGRAKEEVATLLRRGEETWVNSRWVSIPSSEGGGLAEREFLFREVGLERWLNGLDLEGKDVAATIEKRRQRLEKKRRKKKESREAKMDSDEDIDGNDKRAVTRNGALRYGDDHASLLESFLDDEGLFTSDSDSEDEPPMPEAAGQIKVALFRVLASGEIKRGEYSPQFNANDDDEEGASGDGNIDHTTSFAKPKTLDPRSISTQTVTGIDPPDKPYAVFTFLYRGEKQLEKMGIIPTTESQPKTPAVKRGSRQLDFSSLKPLNAKTGTKGFAGYRDAAVSEKERKRAFGKKGADEMDSDAEDDGGDAMGDTQDIEEKDDQDKVLSAEELAQQGEVADGIRKMKLKRQHSGEALSEPAPRKQTISNGPSNAASPSPGPNPEASNPLSAAPSSTAKNAPSVATDLPPEASIGSPFKKHRASLPAIDEPISRLNSHLMSAKATTSALKTETGTEASGPATTADFGNWLKTGKNEEEL